MKQSYLLSQIKNNVLVFISLLALCACKKDDDKHSELIRRNLYVHSKIVGATDSSGQGYNYKIEAGDLLVFDRYHRRADNASVSDDEYEDKFAFQVDPSLTEFSFNDATLKNANPVLAYMCYCMPEKGVYNVTGHINGKKNGNSWDVDVDIKYVFELQSSGGVKYNTVSVVFKENYK